MEISFSLDGLAIIKIIYYLFLLVYMVYSMIIFYHWKSYATDAKVISLTLLTYSLVTLPLLLIAGATIFTM